MDIQDSQIQSTNYGTIVKGNITITLLIGCHHLCGVIASEARSETYQGGTGKNAKVLTTKAERTHAVMLDYWNKNSVKDLKFRKELGLIK